MLLYLKPLGRFQINQRSVPRYIVHPILRTLSGRTYRTKIFFLLRLERTKPRLWEWPPACKGEKECCQFSEISFSSSPSSCFLCFWLVGICCLAIVIFTTQPLAGEGEGTSEAAFQFEQTECRTEKCCQQVCSYEVFTLFVILRIMAEYFCNYADQGWIFLWFWGSWLNIFVILRIMAEQSFTSVWSSGCPRQQLTPTSKIRRQSQFWAMEVEYDVIITVNIIIGRSVDCG